MNDRQQASLIVSNLYIYKHKFMDDFILNEGKYISDKFSELSDVIEKKVKNDLITGTFYLNTLYYINYCYNSKTSEPFFALPFQKKHHPINIIYTNDINDSDIASLFVKDLSKCCEDNYPINIYINLASVKQNKYFFTDLLAALPDEFTHISQLYNYEKIEHSSENTLYQTFKKEQLFTLDKQQEKVITNILYLFSTYERQAHISLTEFNIDKLLTADDIKTIKDFESNDKKILYIATATSKAHSLGMFKNAMEMLSKHYINELLDFIPVLVIAYYLQKSKIINTDINKNDIDFLINLNTPLDRQLYIGSNQLLSKRYCDTCEIVTKKISDIFKLYKDEIFDIISQYLINKHLLNIDLRNEKINESLYEEIKNNITTNHIH